MKLDDIDLNILRALQRDAALSNTQLAEEVGLSASPCWRRIKRMEDAGLIRARVALLDHQALGLKLVVFATVRLSRHDQPAMARFEKAARALPEVVECYMVTGDADFILKILHTDIPSYELWFRDHMLQLDNVQEMHTRIALSHVKYTTELPLDRVRTAGND